MQRKRVQIESEIILYRIRMVCTGQCCVHKHTGADANRANKMKYKHEFADAISVLFVQRAQNIHRNKTGCS